MAEGVTSTMARRVCLPAVILMVVSGAACAGSRLPPTATRVPATASATPPGGGVVEFFDLNLSQSDEEQFTQRANQIYQDLATSNGEVDRGVLIDAYRQMANYPPVGGAWPRYGPAPVDGMNLPQGPIRASGRVNGIIVDPRHPNVVYAAASIGGLWRSVDGGQTWTSLSDHQVPLVYGGLVMDPRDPNTLYALLGEFDATSVGRSYGYLANGLMRSRDAGATWQLIGADTFKGAAVTSLVFGPHGTLYVSSGQVRLYQAPPGQPDFGIFRSTDGGDTWTRLLACADRAVCDPQKWSSSTHVTAFSGGFMSLVRGGDGTLYASLCEVECYGTSLLRSRDDGATWQTLDFSSVLDAWQSANQAKLAYFDAQHAEPYVEGLALAVSATNPKVLLAGGGLYYQGQHRDKVPWSFAMRSDDGGDSWQWLPEAGDYCSATGQAGQCAYDNVAAIDPTDEHVLYLAGSLSVDPATQAWVDVLRRSEDGGQSWRDLTPARPGSLVHPDSHALAFDPSDPRRVWLGTDGGLYVSADASLDPPAWQHLDGGLDTLLFVGVDLHPNDPRYLLGGMQDNGNAYTTDGGRTWQGASRGDAGHVVIDPFNPRIVYSLQFGYGLSRNQNGGAGGHAEWFGPDGQGYSLGLDAGDRWLMYPPLVADANQQGVLYLASNRVYRTTNRGDRWSAVSGVLSEKSIQSLALAPSDSDTLYAGTTEGLIWRTTDGGANWTNVNSAPLPGRDVSGLAVAPNDPQTVYAAIGGFSVQTPQTPGHVFRSTDGGAHWENISFNLPDGPVSALAIDTRPAYAGVYIGGALGVWVQRSGSTQWLPFGTGMPYALVTDLKLNARTGLMAAATFGRSVWVMPMP